MLTLAIAGTDAQQHPETTATDATPAGTAQRQETQPRARPRSEAGTSETGRIRLCAVARNAEQAMRIAVSQSSDSSALFWARKAKSQGDPGSPDRAGDLYQADGDIAAARQSHSYEQAQAQLYQLPVVFPSMLTPQTQDDIHQEQQHYTQQLEEQRRQAELQTQTKKFAFSTAWSRRQLLHRDHHHQP